MQNLPRNVFRVCPDAPTSVAPVRARTPERKDYKIYRAHSMETLRVCENQITKDDLMKAAKCARLTDFKAYLQSSCAKVYLITKDDLPVRHDVYINNAIKTKGTKTKIFHVCNEQTSVAPHRIVSTPVVAPRPSAKKQLLDKAIGCFENGITHLKELSRTL